MRFAFTEDQLLFTSAVADLLADKYPAERVRAAWDTPTEAPDDRSVWQQLADMGVVGLLAPESTGGMGLGALDLHGLLVESGRVAMTEPIVETAAVAVPVLAAAGHSALASVIAGEQTVAVGFADDPVVRVDTDLLLLEHGGTWYLAETAAVTATPQTSVDGSRRLASIEWTPTPGHALPGDIAAARDRAIVAQSAQLVGLARHLLDETVAYVQVREQFGKPVGAQQAIKHKLADVLLAVDYAGPMVARAAHSIDEGDPDASVHASMAKCSAADAAKLAVRHGLQSHGAIAYTVEYDLHMWMKRVWALAAQWGTSAEHRDRVRQHLGL